MQNLSDRLKIEGLYKPISKVYTFTNFVWLSLEQAILLIGYHIRNEDVDVLAIRCDSGNPRYYKKGWLFLDEFYSMSSIEFYETYIGVWIYNKEQGLTYVIRGDGACQSNPSKRFESKVYKKNEVKEFLEEYKKVGREVDIITD